MRTRLFLLTLALAGNFALGAFNTRAQEISIGLQINSVSDFYAPLSAHGAWVDVPPYGRCWHPRVEGDWRPYAEGQWVWTDVGWYWASDEPWAWACYHYGSWIDDANHGWVWIPGTEWAPAWVTWREGPDYIGWAPYGPNFTVLSAPFFVFVDVHHFRDRIYRRSLVINDPTIIEHTRVVSRFWRKTRDFDGVRRQIVVNEGPGVAAVQRATGTRLTAQPVDDLIRRAPTSNTLRLPTGGQPSRVFEQPSSTAQPDIPPTSPTLPPQQQNTPPPQQSTLSPHQNIPPPQMPTLPPPNTPPPLIPTLPPQQNIPPPLIPTLPPQQQPVPRPFPGQQRGRGDQ